MKWCYLTKPQGLLAFGSTIQSFVVLIEAINLHYKLIYMHVSCVSYVASAVFDQV